MKRRLSLLLCAVMLTLSACGEQNVPTPEQSEPPVQGETVSQAWEGATIIQLGDEEISVAIAGNTPILSGTTETETAWMDGEETVVTLSHDIVYYEAGHDFTYGEGTEVDAHTREEADAHAVVTIRKPGTYVLRGKLSAGQVAVDLGDEAEDDPNAVVTLVLDGVDITCTVAPAVIFYNVYECGDKDNPTREVDTSAAGANVVLAEGSVNRVNGSYVARIYKPGTVELSEDGTEVVEAKKLHKYDAAFYSKMSMNILGEGDEGQGGYLSINADNEGLDSEMHLTIDGGSVQIKSGNDGINTNEDGVSVTTINGGVLDIVVTGQTGEGDGIDSNGWIVINGGVVSASACADSMDSGLDADMGIHINGGTVIAGGNMLDTIEADGQNCAVLQFDRPTSLGLEGMRLTPEQEGTQGMGWTLENSFTNLVYSSPLLTAGDYTLWSGDDTLWNEDVQLGHTGKTENGRRPGPGGIPPGGFRVPAEWEDIDFSQLPQIPDRPKREGESFHEGVNMPHAAAPLGHLVATETAALGFAGVPMTDDSGTRYGYLGHFGWTSYQNTA